MLSLRDPADPTNDLGRKAIAIKHVQQTLKALYYTLDRDVRMNTRTSLLSTLVGPSYMLYKARRHKLAAYGKRLSEDNKKLLAIQAREVREGAKSLESSPSAPKEDSELDNIHQAGEGTKSLESQTEQKEESELDGEQQITESAKSLESTPSAQKEGDELENIQQYVENIQMISRT